MTSPLFRSVLTFVASIAALATLSAARQDVGSATVIPIQVTGDAASRFSMVILGDGYTAAEQTKFREHLDKHLNILWSIEPFRSYRNHFNVYAVSIVSGQSGVHCDPEVRESRTTPLQLQFGGGCTNINARGLTVPPSAQAIVQDYARRATPNVDQVLVIANTTTYGGIGGRLATTTGGNALSPLITVHELGHSLGGLTDEYTYRERGQPGGIYKGGEPNSIHTTLLTEDEMRTGQRKWWRWLGEPGEAGGRIGRFEGASGNTKGIWRPSRHSMMISLGYYFDQVARERMTQRIAERTALISAAPPADRVFGRRDVVWIDTAHPVYREAQIAWTVGGVAVAHAANRTYLDLATVKIASGEQTVSVTVADDTPFVRDPAIRVSALTAARSWKIAAASPSSEPPSSFVPAISAATPTSRAAGGGDVLFVDLTHPDGNGASPLPSITWRVDGQIAGDAADRLTLPLAPRKLSVGTHNVSVAVGKGASSSEAHSRTWTVDNTPPTVKPVLSPAIASLGPSTGSLHSFYRGGLTMHLEPADDQPGYVVAEFRVNEDGWHHYYGWPDAPPGTPFRFTPSGSKIKELIYGSLSAEGLSPQPWEPREPGWGTHRIDYRAIDAAGNIGSASTFRITVMPEPVCTLTVSGNRREDLRVTSGVACLTGATLAGSVSVESGASLIVSNTRIEGGLTASTAAVVELVNAGIGGSLRIEGTTERVVVFGTTVRGEAAIVGNRTSRPVGLIGNVFEQPVKCDGNSQPPADGGSPSVFRRGGCQ